MLDTRIIELKPYSGAARDNFYFALDSQYLGTKRVSFKWLCDHLGGSGGDVSGKADKVGQGHRGKLASFTSDGNLADSGLPVDNVATKDDLHNYQPHRAVLDRTQEFTADEKAKLSGIEANANHYVHPQFTKRDKGLYKVKVNGEGHVVDATPVTKSDITALGIPAQDTVYDADTARGISRQNGKLGHINSVNPGTVGPTEGSEEGNSFVIPCITYDAQGHITGAENRRHTISGVIPESTHDDNILSGDSDGTVSWKRLVSAAFGSVSLWLSYKNLEFAARRAYEDEDGNNIKMALADRATMAEVNAAIEEALAKYGGFKIVPRDPNTGEPVVAEPSNRFIYLTKIASSKKDRYEEWIWAIDESDPSVGAWECIGETSIDLSGYVKNITLAGWTEPLAVTQNGVTIPLAVNDGASGLMSGADKKKLDGIETGAQANVKPDWDAAESAPEGILHKPSIPAAAKNGALNITVGSANTQTFTADQADNAPVNVNIPLAGKDTSGTVPVYSEGLMSADQNKKLDEIEAGAQANVKPDWDAAESAPEGILHKPTIPPPQVNSDWNAESGVARILNRPDLSAYATNLAVNVALEGKQDKLVAGHNIQISDNNVISATDTTYSAGTGIAITSDTINVENPLPASTPAEADKYLKVDSGGNPTWADPYYWEATSTRAGIVKTGDDTVQLVSKNEPSRNKHRTYPVQKNADGQMVVNVPWNNGASERYKGIVTLVIQGACIDQTDPVTGVASKVVSDTFADAEIFPSGDNQITRITYNEVEGKPSDSKPEFHIDTQGHLYYTFGEESQEWLLFDMIVHFDTMQGFGYIDDGVVEFVANSALVPQPLMAINQRISVQKTVDGVGGKILDDGIILVVPKSNNLGSGYNILLRAEYWYTSSPPEFFIFDAVDDEGDNMVDDQGNHMIFCEDNPNYTGE